ncbi:MAG: vanadium-dependent haloperoxidase [Archangium sp.]|nr:vanadium-dependent haloperoxidase [Archangium sp.]
MFPLFRLVALSGLSLAACPTPTPAPETPTCGLTAAEWAQLETGHSPARLWDEMALLAIRRDVPQPTVHARNLFHLSAAMFDAWAAYDATADGVFFTEKYAAADVATARNEALSYAAARVLSYRYRGSAGGAPVVACFDEGLRRLGYSPDATSTEGSAPSAIGNRIAARVIDGCIDDGANETNAYADTSGWTPDNPPLAVTAPGTIITAPDRWQQLSLAEAFTQNGIPTGTLQPFVGAHWAGVTPFAMQRTGTAPFHDAGVPPHTLSAEMRDWAVELIRKGAQLEVTAETIDLSPGAIGNNPLGTNSGTGHSLNPATGQPYAANVVPLGDFGRVLAEFWADGPKSETPPGHWNVIANAVGDHPLLSTSLDALEWDVKTYLALNGALHDAAITAWETKRLTRSARPISIIRYLAALPESDPNVLPEIPGLIERITAASSQVGQRHSALAEFVGELAVRCWRGEGIGGVGWQRAALWVPYQRKTFVTPAFPGFVSGHSTFSRAAAEVLAGLTGSAFFPGGLSAHTVPANTGLTFEPGPSKAVTLQWATYFDAADQAGQSRRWGGIHVEPDDFVGRRLGHDVGLDALAKARTYFDGTARP